MIDGVIERLDVLSSAPASETLAAIATAVKEGRPLAPDDLIALAFVAGLEVGTIGRAGRPEYEATFEALRRTAQGSLLETGLTYADRTLLDMIAQAQADT